MTGDIEKLKRLVAKNEAKLKKQKEKLLRWAKEFNANGNRRAKCHFW